MRGNLLCRPALVLVLVGAAAAARAQLPAKDWDDSQYDKFTPATFRTYAPALKEIDFAHLDHELLGAAIFFETNRARLEQRKKPLEYSPALRRSALGHARDMVESDFEAHENPDDPAKRTLYQRLALVGIERSLATENIASFPGRQYPIISAGPGGGKIRIDEGPAPAPYTCLGLAQKLVDGWMLSPGHRASILGDGTRYLGCGAAYWRREMLTPRGRRIFVDYVKACQDFSSQRGPDTPKGDSAPKP